VPQESAMNTRHPWQPRMSDEHLFNPFVRRTDSHPELDDARRLDEPLEKFPDIEAYKEEIEKLAATQNATKAAAK